MEQQNTMTSKIKEATRKAISDHAVFSVEREPVDRNSISDINLIEPFTINNEDNGIEFTGTCEYFTLKGASGMRRFNGKATLKRMSIEKDGETIEIGLNDENLELN